MNLQHGKRSPLLLTPTQNFILFAVFFAGNVTVLIALVHGAGQNKEALKSIARTAESAQAQEAKQRPPEPTAEPYHPSAEAARSSSLRISMPEGWRWRGCQVSDSGDSVEILIGQ